MGQTILILTAGLILGIQHAFEADHMMAISTIIIEQKNPLKAALVGTFWGIGHTTTLFIIGLTLLLLKINIPKTISLSFEFIVGIMLVFLGLRVIIKKRPTLHKHSHKHTNEKHSHTHYHSFFQNSHKQHESFLIGLVHGLAGSGALMILVLSSISNTLLGIYYILIFGLGSIVAMTLTSILLGLPFIFSANKFPFLEKRLLTAAGTVSIILGLFLMYETGNAIITV